MSESSDSAPNSTGLRAAVHALDRLLRGGFTSPEQLRAGRIELPLRAFAFVCLGLGAVYGGLMGLFAVTTRPAVEGWQQVLSSSLKVPALFLATLLVTFPSLYVVSALARSRLRAGDTLRLLLAAVTVNLALLASLGPVAAFFTLSTDSYPFMKLLHVAFFATSGFVGVSFLHRALSTMLEVEAAPGAQPQLPETQRPETLASETPQSVPAPVPVRARVPQADVKVRRVFRIWIVIFGVVGAQMGWILRPFIGAPDSPFAWFRERDSNFVLGVFQSLADLFK